MRLLTAWLLALLAFAATPALAALPPRPTGPVLDQANIFSPQDEAKLDLVLRDLFKRTCNALIVVSVQSLDGRDIQPYATELANSWRIVDKGVLLLIAPSQRQVRIEVSRALQPTISNAVAKEIIERRMVPAFRSGNLAQGTWAGVSTLMVWLDSQYARKTCNGRAA